MTIGDVASCLACLVAAVGVWAVFEVDRRAARRTAEAETRAMAREAARVQKVQADEQARLRQTLEAYLHAAQEALHFMRNLSAAQMGATHKLANKFTELRNRLDALPPPQALDPATLDGLRR